jgi:beta-glucosidase
VPYSLPVTLPKAGTSPVTDADAPYTPAVLSLIAQLEPSNPPTAAQIGNADQLLIGGTNSTCHNVGTSGGDSGPAGTTPVIAPLCWTDAEGVNVTSGPNVGDTTASPAIISLGSSMDRSLANAWGQVEGSEGRELMATGILGPQADTGIYLNWGRGLDTPGEDPLVNGEISAAQVNGIQGSGLMSQVKHFTANNGQGDRTPTTVQDQALHQMLLPDYEDSLIQGNAAAAMCSYQIFHDTGSGVPSTGVPTLYTTSPYATGNSPATWPLNEMHDACEQPLTMTYVLRDMWGSKAIIGPDYGAVHSTSAILQGLDMEPGSSFFGTTNETTTDPTGDTCADAAAHPVSCAAAGAVHVAGIPGTGCGAAGCSVGNAVTSGALPVSVFNQSLATMLYQEQRFGMLGCDSTSGSCANPGGVGGDRTGTAALPAGPTTGKPVIGTKNGDAAVVEKMAEEGAVLLKNGASTLPVTGRDLKSGVAVSGPGAEYTIANPNNEGATGFADQDAIDPLQQLKGLSGEPAAFSYSPVGGPTGYPVGASALSTSSTSVTGGLERTTGPGSPEVNSTLDYTTVSGHGQLRPGDYTWAGYVDVPTADTYTFRFQYSSGIPASDVTLSIDGQSKALTSARSFYSGEYYGGTTVPVGITNAGYTQPGLTSTQAAPGTLSAGYHAVTITFDNTTSSPASFRFADSQHNGDIAKAAAQAKGKSMAIVFANDNGRNTCGPFSCSPATTVSSLPASQVSLIEAVAAVNPNTVVVLNTAQDIVTRPWISLPSVKSVLEMWNAGEEGGIATARLLLGQADPSGHTTDTWPVNGSDTIYGYHQTTPLYPGDTTGTHPERAGSTTSTDWTQGIYSGYRYYDKEGIPVQFPFGYGLSYTSFKFSGLHVSRAAGGGLDVRFALANTGNKTGAQAPQVYLGPPGSQPAGIQFAVRSLAQFDRVTLRPGRSENLTEHVALRQLQYWSSAKQQWVLGTGSRTVYVGDADAPADLPLQQTITVAGPASAGAAGVTCSGEQINATTINGNLTVPRGSWCDLADVTVTGSVIAHYATGLRITGSKVGGSVSLADASAARDPLSSGANVICNSVIQDNLTVSGSGQASAWNIGSCGAVSVGGSVRFTANAATGSTITATSVAGDLACTGNGGVSAAGDTVQGHATGQCAPSAATSRRP